jgi:hypothetical protein
VSSLNDDGMTPNDVQTRRAHSGDAEAIALAHLDSILSIGPAFYRPDVVEAWSSGPADAGIQRSPQNP